MAAVGVLKSGFFELAPQALGGLLLLGLLAFELFDAEFELLGGKWRAAMSASPLG